MQLDNCRISGGFVSLLAHAALRETTVTGAATVIGNNSRVTGCSFSGSSSSDLQCGPYTAVDVDIRLRVRVSAGEREPRIVHGAHRGEVWMADMPAAAGVMSSMCVSQEVERKCSAPTAR